MEHTFNLFRRVSRRLGALPSLAYGGLYLATLVLYAIAYSKLPGQFYHSTVQFERGVQEDATRLLNPIQAELRQQFREAHHGDRVTVGGWLVDCDWFTASNLKSNQGIISFDVLAVAFSVDPKLAFAWSFAYSFRIEDQPATLTWTFYAKPPGGEGGVFVPRPAKPGARSVRISADVADSNGFDVALASALEPRNSLLVSIVPSADTIEKARHPVMQFSTDLYERLVAFSKAMRGFPAHGVGHFARMLYLSATTITTVGFGDIVPLTSFARLLVASEAVVGVVLIGLFLNALAYESRL